MTAPPVEVSVTQEGLDALIRAIGRESDGKALRKDLAKNTREALKPAVVQAKSAIMSMASNGPSSSPALRPQIAKKIRAEVKLTGRWTGARVRARRTHNVRGFMNAPKRTQRVTWRTQTFGRPDSWREQHGKPGWFDDAMQADRQKYIAAVHKAMEDMAARIASRSH
jgi:hypothetical protein